MAENRIKPERFEDRIIFLSMYNDIDWTKEEEHFKSVFHAHRFPKERKNSGVERTPTSPKVCGNALQK